MKAVFRIPTTQYGFLEVEEEFSVFGTPLDLRQRHDELVAAFARETGEGLSPKEFNAFMDTYLSTGKPGEIDDWARMSDEQKNIVNEVKKCFLRLKNKQN